MHNLPTALSLHADSHIMDLACGRGRHALFLSEQGYDVTGIDLSPNSIAYAQQEARKKAWENNKKKIKFFLRSIMRLLRLWIFIMN